MYQNDNMSNLKFIRSFQDPLYVYYTYSKYIAHQDYYKTYTPYI